jgi:pyruvate,water dikinase
VPNLYVEKPAAILDFIDPLCGDSTLVGSKAAHLSLLCKHYSVPAGFVITASAFSLGAGEKFSSEVSSRYQHGMPDILFQDFITAYRKLKSASRSESFSVAIRSSALEEDSNDASFAGQYDTYLNVREELLVAKAIIDCWISADSYSSMSYRRERGLSLNNAGIAVIIQEMLACDVSAVVFSANPITGNKNEVVVNSNWGLCESIVSGIATPDMYVVEKGQGKIIESVVAEKETMTMQMEVGVGCVETPLSMRSRSSLEEEQVLEISNLAIELEAKMGWPVDVECAYSQGDLYLLQCRPITVLV